MKIRPAVGEDGPTIAEFNRRMAWETEEKHLDLQLSELGVKNLLGRPDLGFYLVAELKGRVVGCLMVTFEWSDWRNGLFWWVQSVFVLPEHRRKGIYRSLYERVQKLARERLSVCGIRLYVHRANTGAIASYQKLGMSETPYLMLEEEFDRKDE